MRALLEDATYNPQYIRWENKEEGVFRIVPGQSKQVARLWGLKKNNPNMTFDKLSRSLRYILIHPMSTAYLLTLFFLTYL